ncbi:MAG: hypothetical protein FJW40_15845 [Acidobacteria bacterium]|nr:hypothetical protein [Acidobacteriota bacterium]
MTVQITQQVKKILSGSKEVGVSADGPVIHPIGRFFGDLKIRPKLIVLHNAFFLILVCAVYFSIVPLFESRVSSAKAREITLAAQVFEIARPPFPTAGLSSYFFFEGTADELGIPEDARSWLSAHPGRAFADPARFSSIFKRAPGTGLYWKLTIPNDSYEAMVDRLKITIFIVLGAIYCLAVLLLETVIMPLYVYRPINLMLSADSATRQGDTSQEIIPDALILDDEIGQIMRSRNSAIAELRARAQQLEAARQNLLKQDRLASLGLLSASVAHELNTPLAVLRGSVEKLVETAPGPQARERLARVLRVTDRLRSISESLLDFARVRPAVTGPVEVRDAVQQAWDLVRIDEKAAGIRFSNEVATGTRVSASADRLVQVFVNLLRNALFAVSVDGEIRVEARLRPPNRVAIAVLDNGPGIPSEVLPEVFDAFVTTRLDAKGTGLGLTVSQGIVEQMGGTVSAANRPDGGACLEVVLDAAGAA